MWKQKFNTEIKPINKSLLLNEWKIGAIGLILSAIILICKLYYNNKEYLASIILERQYVSYETITEEGEIMFKYTWNTAIKYSKYWFPLVCGLVMTYFTWLLVYLDSNVPGVQPPSPFSPTKYKVQSGHTFHLNYTFAVMVGLLLTSYLYWRGIQI